MKVTILGSGTGVPSLERSSPGYLLRHDEHQCLIDCGSGTLRQLHRAGGLYKALSAVFFTHTHPDHIGDLVALLHGLKVTPGFRREVPLHLFGPAGFGDFYRRLIAQIVSPPSHFNIEIEEAEARFTFNGIQVTTVPTRHSDQLKSIAYRFETGARSVVFSGDCDYDDGIVQIARDSDALIIDCSFPDALKMRGHLSASECGQVAARANVKRLILSHLYPVPPGQDMRLAEARRACAAEVRLAEDLMSLEL